MQHDMFAHSGRQQGVVAVSIDGRRRRGVAADRDGSCARAVLAYVGPAAALCWTATIDLSLVCPVYGGRRRPYFTMGIEYGLGHWTSTLLHKIEIYTGTIYMKIKVL